MKNRLIEILYDSKLIDKNNPKKPIFVTKKVYKDELLSITKDALDNDKAINEDYGNNGVKEHSNDTISYQLLASNRPELGFVYYNDVREFLQENGIRKIDDESHYFIYDKPENFFECYRLYEQLDSFLQSFAVTNDKEKVVLYYKEPIVIQKKVDNLECKETEKVQDSFQKLLDDIAQDRQTKIEFFKKALYDIFKQSIKEERLTIVNLYKDFNKVYQEYLLVKQAYIDSLDTDKIKDEFKDKYNETMNFLNTVISSLYTKTLFIPLTIIFALSQRVSIQNTDGKFYIFIALELFLLLLAYLIYGSKSILENVKLQIEEMGEETKDYPSLSIKQKSLSNMYKSVRNRLYWILASVAGAMGGLIYIYLPLLKEKFGSF